MTSFNDEYSLIMKSPENANMLGSGVLILDSVSRLYWSDTFIVADNWEGRAVLITTYPYSLRHAKNLDSLITMNPNLDGIELNAASSYSCVP
jgi:hypothetical protein